MKTKTWHLYFSATERQLLIHSLIESRNELIAQGKYTDVIDELLIKVIEARIKKMKVQIT